MAGPLEVMDYIAQQGALGKQAGEQRYATRLLGQAYADPAQRQTYLSKLGVTQPELAMDAQAKFEADDAAKQAKRAELVTETAKALSVLPESAWAGAWPTMRQRFLDSDPELYSALPEQADVATFRPLVQQLSGGVADTSIPSSVREAQMFQADPSLLATRRQMYGSYSYGEVPLPDGTVAQTRRNSRTGEMEMVLPGGRVVPMAGATSPTGGTPATAASPVAGSGNFATVVAEDGGEADPTMAALPESEQIKASQLAIAKRPFHVDNGRVIEGESAGLRQPPPAMEPARRTVDRIPITELGGGALGFGRSKEAEAARIEQAKIDVQLANAGAVADSEAEAARKKKLAEAEAERAAAAPKKIAAYQQALSASEGVVGEIDKALGNVNNWSTGYVGARLRDQEGTDAYDLAATIETIKGNLGFDRLQQMRDNSPTGGALGAIAVQELVALQSTVANLDPNQSKPQIEAALKKVKGHYEKWQKSVADAIAEEQARASSQRPAAAPAASGGWGIQRVSE